MKIGNLVSISGSEKGIKIATIFILMQVLINTVFAVNKNVDIDPGITRELQNYKIEHIYFEYEQGKNKLILINGAKEYELLLTIKPGDAFNYKKNRESMANLYKTGLFSKVKVEIEKRDNNQLNLYYALTPQYIVGTVKIETSGKISKKHIANAILSLRKGIPFDKDTVTSAQEEIIAYLKSRGYFNPEINYTIQLPDPESKHFHSSVEVLFNVKPGQMAVVENIFLTIPNKKIYQQFRNFFSVYNYIPTEFQKIIERAKKLLKKQNYYFPDIKVKENFLDGAKTKVNLEVTVKPGYQYELQFIGMKKKSELIASIWEKKVFEKWAENESTARILYHLKNKGYLKAEVKSTIVVKNLVKYVTFTIKKNTKYSLGKIQFTGNQAFPEKKLITIIKTDNLFFDKHIYLRFRSLRVDQEVLRLFYYFNGYPSADIRIEPIFRDHKVDINFVISEGKKFTVDTLLFNGNRTFVAETFSPLFQTQVNGPFVQQKLNEDLERLRNFYYAKGFDEVKITADISPGNAKSILINIEEGQSYKVGNLIIIGASNAQEKLIRNSFPLKSGDFYDRTWIDSFQNDIENSAIFTDFKVIKIERTPGVVDVLIEVTPDTNKYYGFGVGGEWAVGDPARLRSTLEYQKRNIFNSYSSLSSVLQIGGVGGKITALGVISYDTPFLFRRKVNSELKAWSDSEEFPSYSFTRIGVSESIIQRLTQSSYFLSSFLFYKTKLYELNITPSVIDQLDTSNYTAGFRLSYVREKRDDPFNPTAGNFFSSDLKIGLLMLKNKEQYPFVKFQWSYQKVFKFLKNGVMAFTIRNGVADGDLAVTERFFAGGVNTFRGTKTDRLGPRDSLHNNPKGGNAMLLLNLDATFPIPFIASNEFYYTVFFDVGNVFAKVSQFRLTKMEKALGFGLKFKTQLGPLRLEFAWNLEKKEEGNFVVHIGIGNVL